MVDKKKRKKVRGREPGKPTGAGGTITEDVKRRLGKETTGQRVDRAIKSRVDLSAVEETKRKEEAKKRGVPFVPGTRAQQELGTPVKDIQVGDDVTPTDTGAGTSEEAFRSVEEIGITPEITERQNRFILESQGLSPFLELPLYQQFLADVAVLGGVGNVFTVGAGLSSGVRGAIANANALQKAALIGKKVKAATTAAGRFAVNTKTTVATGKLLLKRGVQAAVVTFIAGTLGTYPFSGFIKEETLQALTFKSGSLREAGLLDEAEIFLQMREAVHVIEWQDFVPYANVLKSLREYFDADIQAIKAERALIEKDKKILAGEEKSQFDLLRKGRKEAERR